ncbi:MAG: hypothetical protein WBQ59_27460, partial [Candidatus Acidiferrum sp.]
LDRAQPFMRWLLDAWLAGAQFLSQKQRFRLFVCGQLTAKPEQTPQAAGEKSIRKSKSLPA